jgi:hypothetical protein
MWHFFPLYQEFNAGSWFEQFIMDVRDKQTKNYASKTFTAEPCSHML